MTCENLSSFKATLCDKFPGDPPEDLVKWESPRMNFRKTSFCSDSISKCSGKALE